MLIKAWRFLAIPSVIQQLQKDIAKAKGNHEHKESLLFEKRHDILISIDAILNRISIPFFHEHDTIINHGGIEVIFYLLKTFNNDMEMVYLIFHVLNILIHIDAEKLKRRQHLQYDHSNITSGATRTEYSQALYMASRRIHILEGKDLIQSVLDIYYDTNEDIRMLGKSIIKDLTKAESFAAMEILSHIQDAVKANVSFETYCAINKMLVVSPHMKEGNADNTNTNTIKELHKLVSPGRKAWDIVISNMLKFSDNKNIQCICLDIILQSLQLYESHNKEHVERDHDLFSNESCIDALLRLLQSSLSESFDIQWRAHLSLLKLTYSHDVCNYINRNAGCLVILDILNTINVPLLKLHDQSSLYQITLWTVANLCKVESCVETFVKIGLKQVLYKLHTILLEESSKTLFNMNSLSSSMMIPIILVIPLSLQTLFPLKDLEHASLFENIEQKVAFASNRKMMTKTVNNSHNSASSKILPLLSADMNIGPSHGTTKELFSNGIPGLI